MIDVAQLYYPIHSHGGHLPRPQGHRQFSSGVMQSQAVLDGHRLWLRLRPQYSSKHGAYWSDGLIVNWRDNFFHHSLGYHKLFINAVILQTKFPYILCPGAVAASTLLSSVDSSSSDGGSAGTLWCCFMIAASRRSICRERREREASSEELNRALYSCAIYTWFQHSITSVSTLAHSVSCKLHTREKTRKASQASQN